MSVLAVIPARLGATRLPRKPLRDLGGAPLVIRVLERVRSLGLADRVVVATEAEEVAGIVRRAGGEAMITSDAHLSGTDRVAEVAAHPAYGDHEIVQRSGICRRAGSC